jgi:acetyl esterase/lipase
LAENHKPSILERMFDVRTEELAARGTIRDAPFVPEWMNLEPHIPEPVFDWIERRYADVPYGADPKQKLDIYLPNRSPYPAEKLPLLVLVHGGGFSHMDKADWHVYPGFFALREGFGLASVNYRLAPKHKYPAAVEDTKAALRFLAFHAAEYGFDTQNVFLVGTSAGGNLVSLAALQPEAASYGLTIQGVAALCPGASLTDMYERMKSVRNPLVKLLIHHTVKQYLGVTPKKDPRPMHEGSAEFWIADAAESGRRVPPFFIQQGTADPLVLEEHSRKFYERLQAVLPANDLVYDVLQGAGHAGGGPDYFEERNIMAFVNFFKEHMK